MKKVILTLTLAIAMPLALVNCASSGSSPNGSRGSDTGSGTSSGGMGGSSTSPSGSSTTNPYGR